MKNIKDECRLMSDAEVAAEMRNRRQPRRRQPRPRNGLSKTTRFAVFSRDTFTCRYCGKQPPEVTLEVDHIQPVCQGGSNEPENLITSCFDCNRGKGAKTIAQAAPTESDRLRLLQEHCEQVAAQRAVVEAAKARDEFQQTICNYYCEMFGREAMDKRALSLYANFITKYGADMVFSWFEIALRGVGSRASDDVIAKYVCGIRRNQVKDGLISEEGVCQ